MRTRKICRKNNIKLNWTRMVLSDTKMAESAESVVLFNCVTMALVGALTWFCGAYMEIAAFNIIKTPLQATWNIACVLTAWQIIGFCALQKVHKINVRNVALGLVVNCLFVVLFHIVLVAFGAPLTKTVTETFHLALLLMVLTSLPCCLVLGVNSTKWCNLFLLKSPAEGSSSPASAVEKAVWLSSLITEHGPLERCIWWCSLGSVVGTWLGAVPIPLDWDRPWQAWPISCVIGTLLGYTCGNFCAILDTFVRSLEKKIKDS